MAQFGAFAVLMVLIALGAAQQQQQQPQQQQKQDPKCLLPKEPGPCRMNMDRFYYNAQRNACEPFKFGGCRGNDNKFGFLKTCEDACLLGVKKPASGGSAAPATNAKPAAAVTAAPVPKPATAAAATSIPAPVAAVATTTKAPVRASAVSAENKVKTS